MFDTSLAANSHKTLAEQVTVSFRNDIRFGFLKANENLKEEYLAARYGTSRNPIRQAIQTLSTEGFIKVIPYTGIQIIPLTASMAEEMLSLGMTLVTQILGKAVINLDRNQKIFLDKVLDRIDATNDLETYDILLHEFVMGMLKPSESTVNPYFLNLVYLKSGIFIRLLFDKKMQGEEVDPDPRMVYNILLSGGARETVVYMANSFMELLKQKEYLHYLD
jgi:DNA-binding GntR family transcriptional regulator